MFMVVACFGCGVSVMNKHKGDVSTQRKLKEPCLKQDVGSVVPRHLAGMLGSVL